MGESAKARSFRLSDETMRQIEDLQKALEPMAANPTDTLRIAIFLLHAEIVQGQTVRPIWEGLQRLQSVNLCDKPGPVKAGQPVLFETDRKRA